MNEYLDLSLNESGILKDEDIQELEKIEKRMKFN